MRLIMVLSLFALALATPACRSRGHSVPQAIVGAMLIDGTARPPVANAVLLVNHGKVEAVGPASGIRIPGHYNRIDATGRFLFPADVSQSLEVGSEANLLLLFVNPALEPEFLNKIAGQMESGRWVQYPR